MVESLLVVTVRPSRGEHSVSGIVALRMEVARLRKAGLALEKALDAGGAEVRELHKARIEADADILALRRQFARDARDPRRAVEAAGQRDRVVSLSEEAAALRYALKASEAAKGRLKARLRRADEARRARAPSAGGAELRKAFALAAVVDGSRATARNDGARTTGRIGAGVRRAAHRVRPLPGSGAGSWGFKGGRSAPLARPQRSTWRRLAYAP